VKEKSTVNTTTKVALEYCLEALNIVNRLESAMIAEDFHMDDIDNIRELRKSIQSSMQIASEMYARSQKEVASKNMLNPNVFKKATRLLRGK
jgi:single-stranded DNA-specific DHH superfamily exonuclease